MTRKRSFLLVASFALSAVLIVVLIKVGRINLRETLHQLEAVSFYSFAALVALTGLHVYLANLKWRKIDASLRSSADSAPSGAASFAFTSAGVALGQVLPVQISMSAARTLGTFVHGSAVKRGTVGTLFEQSFDVAIVLFLAVASVATWFLRGGWEMWLVTATTMTILALAAVGPLIGLIRWLTTRASETVASQNRILRKMTEVRSSGLLSVPLARHLMALSALRFLIQVLMAAEVASAVGAHIAVWQLAAALPLVVIACILSLTPAGLGVNELSYAFALGLFGTPLAIGARWALENRILVAASCLVVAAGGAATLYVGRIFAPRAHGAI